MSSTLGNLARVPINSDALNVTGDMTALAQSLEVVVPVASDAAGDTYATERAAAGFAVSDTRPLIVYNTTTKTLRIKDSSGWRNLQVAIKHAEFTTAAVTQNANAGIAFGAATQDNARTFDNTFCSASGATISISETGLYLLTSFPQPPSSLGSSVHIWATNSTEGTVLSVNFQSYGNTSMTATTVAYLQSGSTCTFGITGANTVSGIVARIKMTKIQG